MANPINTRIVADIKRRHGSVIDLDRSPHAIIDIIRDFRHVLDDDGSDHPQPPGPTPPGGGGGNPGAPGNPSPPRGPDSPPPSPPGGGGNPGSPGNPPPPRGPDDRELGMSTLMNIMLDMKREIGGLHAKLDQHVGASKAVSAQVAAPSLKG